MLFAINFLAVIMLIVCVLMTLVILVQEDKSGGGIGIIGGSSQSFFGASSANILTRITTVLLTIFFVLSIVIGSLSAKTTKDAAIGDKIISELEFEDAATSKTQPQIVINAPESINTKDFEAYVLDKLTDETTKTELLSYYTISKDGAIYTLTEDAKKNKTERVSEILNSVNYSSEAATTVVE